MKIHLLTRPIILIITIFIILVFYYHNANFYFNLGLSAVFILAGFLFNRSMYRFDKWMNEYYKDKS